MTNNEFIQSSKMLTREYKQIQKDTGCYISPESFIKWRIEAKANTEAKRLAKQEELSKWYSQMRVKVRARVKAELKELTDTIDKDNNKNAERNNTKLNQTAYALLCDAFLKLQAASDDKIDDLTIISTLSDSVNRIEREFLAKEKQRILN